MSISIDTRFLRCAFTQEQLSAIQSAESVEIVRRTNSQVKIAWYLPNGIDIMLSVPKKHIKES